MDDTTLGALFGKRLHDLRAEHRLTQQEVGGWFDMRKSTVSQWEGGRLPHPTIIAALARRFGVSADFLLGLSEARRPADGPVGRVAEEPADYRPPKER